jgi:two-component system, cell cycle sensor histidine kinase PleC
VRHDSRADNSYQSVNGDDAFTEQKYNRRKVRGGFLQPDIPMGRDWRRKRCKGNRILFDRNLSHSAKPTLLSRYCDTMGEMRLREYTEKAMKAARADAELSNKAKSSLLGTMSHEMRTPLNAIIGFSEIIEASAGRASDPSLGEHASEIKKAGRHLLGVINDVLEMSKLESGALQLNIDKYALGEVVEDCMPMVRDRINAKKQRLDLRIAKSTPVLPIDMRRIRQVVLNLLTNASKFTPEGGEITVVVRPSNDGGGIVAISDTGVGMTPEEMRIAIRPFGQVQNMYTRTEEGTGLGLAIAQGFIVAHGGAFYIESEPNAGTTVLFALPGNRDGANRAAPAKAGGGERSVARRPNLLTMETKR